MSYGLVTDQQANVIRPLVRGRVVHDLGCGDRYLSGRLVAWGARGVVAVDSHPFGPHPGPWVTTVTQSFEEYLKTRSTIDVAFVSWPTTGAYVGGYGLLGLIILAKRVIYLGKNTDGTMCGRPKLFHHLMRRPLLAHVPDEWNTLIGYGSGAVIREAVLEEKAGMDMTKVYRSVPTMGAEES